MMRTSWNRIALILLALSPALAQLRPGDAGAAGMSPAGLDRVSGLLESEIRDRSLGSASILIARRGTIVLHKGFGAQPDSVFLVASITKPVTATALMMLVERGKVSLGEPVSTYLPEFKGGERSKARVVDLLSHTSGMPDMLPENTELRRAHAPLSEFVKRSYTTPLLFTPGTAFRYQSMGILLAADIVEKISGIPLREFERKEIFEPLGMQHTALGLGKMRIPDTVQIQESDSRDAASWGGNSEYWRNMGHPWGGMHTTTKDLAILLQTFLNGGAYSGKRILGPAAVKVMISDQNTHLNAPWGVGWALGRSTAWNEFGDLVSPRTFGHAGASGTVAWADPETQLMCVILTNRPLSVDKGLFLRLVSNAVAASVEK